MDKTEATQHLKQAKSFFDFINVELYTKNKYSVKQQKYWIWSELKGSLQEYEVTEGLRYDLIKPYVEKGLVYVAR